MTEPPEAMGTPPIRIPRLRLSRWRVLLGILGGHRFVGGVFVLVALALGTQLWHIDGRRWPVTWPKPRPRNAPSHAR